MVKTESAGMLIFISVSLARNPPAKHRPSLSTTILRVLSLEGITIIHRADLAQVRRVNSRGGRIHRLI